MYPSREPFAIKPSAPQISTRDAAGSCRDHAQCVSPLCFILGFLALSNTNGQIHNTIREYVIPIEALHNTCPI